MIEIPKKEPLNIVPFIDIMLVLLAIVLSVSTFIAQGEIKINLPQSETASAVDRAQDSVKIQVDPQGQLFIDGEPKTIDELDRTIQAMSRQQPIAVTIDKDARFDHFIQVIDALKKHAHENFSITTEKLSNAS